MQINAYDTLIYLQQIKVLQATQWPVCFKQKWQNESHEPTTTQRWDRRSTYPFKSYQAPHINMWCKKHKITFQSLMMKTTRQRKWSCLRHRLQKWWKKRLVYSLLIKVFVSPGNRCVWLFLYNIMRHHMIDYRLKMIMQSHQAQAK